VKQLHGLTYSHAPWERKPLFRRDSTIDALFPSREKILSTSLVSNAWPTLLTEDIKNYGLFHESLEMRYTISGSIVSCDVVW
jgi:hypothetical protein